MLDIRKFIPHGKDAAISRGDLGQILGLCDRTIREAIEIANNDSNETPILNLGYGYFIPSADEEEELINEYIAIENARQRAINRKIRKMKKYLQSVS